MEVLIGDRVRSADELLWARNRPLFARPPQPRVGDRGFYRSNDFFLKLHDAEVVEVKWGKKDDLMLWEWQRGRIVPVPDPWPLVVLKVPGMSTLIETREARLEGSAGWLPLDWEKWPRPIHDREAPAAELKGGWIQ